jgi:hypothetical protein
MLFSHRVLRRIFEPKREEVAGQRKTHSDEHHVYSSPNIVKLIKSRMRWAGHIALMGEMRNVWKKLESQN